MSCRHKVQAARYGDQLNVVDTLRRVASPRQRQRKQTSGEAPKAKRRARTDLPGERQKVRPRLAVSDE